jgi:hypothetical protein
MLATMNVEFFGCAHGDMPTLKVTVQCTPAHPHMDNLAKEYAILGTFRESEPAMQMSK